MYVASRQGAAHAPIGAARKIPPPPKPEVYQLGNLGHPSPTPSWHNHGDGGQHWHPAQSWNNNQHTTELALRTTQHKAIYDIVEGLGSQSQAMVGHMTNTFATAATATQSTVMQTIQALQTSQTEQNAAQMTQMAEANANQMEILRSVMSDIIHMVRPPAPPVQPIPLPMHPIQPAAPPPNWMLTGGSSGSGGENPTGYQWAHPEWAHPDWSEHPTASTEYPGWESHRTWTAAPAPSAVRCTVFVRPETAPITPPPSPPPVDGWIPAETPTEEEPIEPDDATHYNDRWRSRGWGSGWHKDHHEGSGHQNI